MKIKKFLEKVAEEDRESLIDDGDIEFLASKGIDYDKKREASQNEPDSSYYRAAKPLNNRALFAGIACFLVVAITAVALSLYFSLKPSPVDSPIHYFEDNYIEVDSNLQELNDDLQLFSLTVDENNYRVSIRRTYDSLSGDDLFFTLEFVAKQGKKFTVDIVVNKFYTHDELPYSNFDKLTEANLSEYAVKYEEISQPVSGPFITVNCMGEIKIGDQWIYIIHYNETAIGQSTFVNTLESLISFK